MRKNVFLSYMFLAFVFIITTFIEVINYFAFDANTFGLFYLILNIIILFLFILTILNYRKQLFKSRIIVMFIILILGFISSYYLYDIVLNIYDYKDQSNLFMDKIYICYKIIKPIIYYALLIISSIEIIIKNNLFYKLKKICYKKIQ